MSAEVGPAEVGPAGPASARRARRSHGVAFRGALWITLIALLTTGVALTIQYVSTTRLLDTRSREMLDDEAAGLVERYGVGGVFELAAYLRRQQALPRLNEFFYLLSTADGTPLAGNLSMWPAEVDNTGFERFAAPVQGADGRIRRRQVETRALLLEGGYRLLVGQLAEDRAALRARYLSALFWSLLVTGALGLLLGWWFSRRGLAFVEKVSATGDRFLAGNLEERVPVSDRGDEYDRLAATINACFVEIEDVVRSLRAATDGMAHDLKTPLTRIGARLELAEMRGGDAGELRVAIRESRADLEALLRIIEGILNLARAEATTAASFVEIDLAAITREVIELFEPVAEDRGLFLTADLKPAILRGSPTLLSQLVANLIDNAIKFSPPDGLVNVHTSSRNGEAFLAVCDAGPGIPADRHEDVLHRFVRLDQSRALPGTGMGLSIVNASARVHHATLRMFDNAPGLRVEVQFPHPRR